MNKRHLIALLVLIGCCTSVSGQTYVSPQQKTTSQGFANRVETKLIKKVFIDGEHFRLELPDGGLMSGTMKLFREIESETEKRIVYEIDSGGLLAIVDDVDNNYDHIYVNLMATPRKKTYTFWLTEGNKGDD